MISVIDPSQALRPVNSEAFWPFQPLLKSLSISGVCIYIFKSWNATNTYAKSQRFMETEELTRSTQFVESQFTEKQLS